MYCLVGLEYEACFFYSSSTDCALNIHRHCVKVVEENCPGPLTKKEKGNDRISKLMDKIRPEREARRKPSSHNFAQSTYIYVNCKHEMLMLRLFELPCLPEWKTVPNPEYIFL
jgi:hypothetical protein